MEGVRERIEERERGERILMEKREKSRWSMAMWGEFSEKEEKRKEKKRKRKEF